MDHRQKLLEFIKPVLNKINLFAYNGFGVSKHRGGDIWLSIIFGLC